MLSFKLSCCLIQIPKGLKSGGDLSDIEEVVSVVSPIEVGQSLSKLFPQFPSLLQEGRERVAPHRSYPTTLSIKSKFYHVLKTEKALYDRQLYHVAKGFAAFYMENFRDDDKQRELDAVCRQDIRMLFELIVAAVVLGEMSIAQLVSSADVMKPVFKRLYTVRKTVQKHHYQNVHWLYDLEELLNNLSWLVDNRALATMGKESDGHDDDDGEESLYFVTEPAEDFRSVLLSPLKLDEAKARLRPFAQELLRSGSVVMELSPSGVIISVSSAWQDILGSVERIQIICLLIYISQHHTHPWHPILQLNSGTICLEVQESDK